MIHSFPKLHFFAAAFVGTVLVFSLALSPSSNVNATRIPIELKFAQETDASNSIDNYSSNTNIEQPEDTNVTTQKEIPAPSSSSASTTENWKEFTVSQGNTLSELFIKAGLNDKVMYDVLKNKSLAKELTKIYPGEKIAFLLDPENQLYQVKLTRSPIQSILATKNEEGYFADELLIRTPESHVTYAEGIINSSLFLAGQKAGLSEAQIMELANIFGWDIDFILDIREGDKFYLLYEELYLDGEKYKNGRILAAKFINQGSTYSAILFEKDNGDTNYYTAEGDSMRKAFIRTPVDFARISSHFNLQRKHPILHKIRAHKGTDYAAAHGTPIKATGDGKVVHARNKGGYGKTVIIQHGNDITTLYAHLSKYARGINEGTRVKQGQVIGYIGSTGLASGPHLHYEFRENGVHKNPLKVKLPHADPVPANQLSRFKQVSSSYLAQLSTFSESYQLAANQQ